MCISGDVWQLSEQQWKVLDDGIAFYKKLAPIIKKGFTTRYGNEISSYRNPIGWQGILREGENGQAFVLLHGFRQAAGTEVSVPVPEGYQIADIYSYEPEEPVIKDGKLFLRFREDMKAVAVYLEKNNGTIVF